MYKHSFLPSTESLSWLYLAHFCKLCVLIHIMDTPLTKVFAFLKRNFSKIYFQRIYDPFKARASISYYRSLENICSVLS